MHGVIHGQDTETWLLTEWESRTRTEIWMDGWIGRDGMGWMALLAAVMFPKSKERAWLSSDTAMGF